VEEFCEYENNSSGSTKGKILQQLYKDRGL